MKNSTEEYDEFYIGYLPEAPPRTGRLIRYSVGVIGVIVVSVAFILSTGQQEFSSSVFEYGINTEVEGRFFPAPIPHLLAEFGADADGNIVYQSILLVGYGKTGVQSLPSLTSGKFDGKKVKLGGSLIYGDGKSLLQVTEENVDRLRVVDSNVAVQHKQKELGVMTLTGEIIDPKCYFGVMKPGEGKPHRSCAIRCISGGIPPVFHTNTNEYYILTNERFAPINQEVLDIVGDRIVLSGRVVQLDDLKILAIQSSAVKELSKYAATKEQLIAFEKGITRCASH